MSESLSARFDESHERYDEGDLNAIRTMRAVGPEAFREDADTVFLPGSPTIGAAHRVSANWRWFKRPSCRLPPTPELGEQTITRWLTSGLRQGWPPTMPTTCSRCRRQHEGDPLSVADGLRPEA